MLVKTPKIVALLKVVASLEDWHSHAEIDDAIRENLSEEELYSGQQQWGASTLERLKRLRTEGLVESEMRHNVSVTAPKFHVCCEKWNAWTVEGIEGECDHETKYWYTEYTKRISLTYWVITQKGKELAPDMVANTTRDFH